MPATTPANTDREVRLKFNDLVLYMTFLEFIGFGCEPILVDLVFQISLKFHVDFWQVSYFQFSKQKSNQCNGWESYSKCKSSYSFLKSQIMFHVSFEMFHIVNSKLRKLTQHKNNNKSKEQNCKWKKENVRFYIVVSCFGKALEAKSSPAIRQESTIPICKCIVFQEIEFISIKRSQ